jgi:hypothetical protein
MPSTRHPAVLYHSQVIDRVSTIKDVPTQQVRKFNKMTQSWERDRFTLTDVQLQRIGLKWPAFRTLTKGSRLNQFLKSFWFSLSVAKIKLLRTQAKRYKKFNPPYYSQNSIRMLLVILYANFSWLVLKSHAACYNITFACLNHTCEYEEIILVRVEIKLCVWKSHSAWLNHTRACWNHTRVCVLKKWANQHKYI